MTRVGFKVTKGSIPIKDCSVIGNLLIPIAFTDSNGESFNIAPFFINLATYIVDVVITCKKGISVHIHEIIDEINSYYKVDISTGKWTREKLTSRIGGDGFYSINEGILKTNQLVTSPTDSMLNISNCSICLYYNRIRRTCIVNGDLTPEIPISQPSITTSPFYYPFFLLPSKQRIERDSKRHVINHIV